MVWLAACGFDPGGGDDGIDPMADSDADGILDGDDNCVTTVNPDQRDHDADAIGDACDKCPHLGEAGDPDGDGDGVGDSCDPRPAVAGDAIRMFEGFYDATAIDEWDAVGDWDVDAGWVHQRGTADVATLAPPGDVASATIATTAIVESDGTGLRHVGVAVASVDFFHHHSCAAERSSDGSAFMVAYFAQWWPDEQETRSPWAAGALDLGDTADIVHGISSAGIACDVSGSRHADPTIWSTNGRVSLWTEDVAVGYDYVFVVETRE
jgi:hypothetical protein